MFLATCSSKAFSYLNSEGVILYNTIDSMPCKYGLSVKSKDNLNISKCLYFDPNSNGETVWNELYEKGEFSKLIENTKNDNVFGEMACAVASQVTIKPQEAEDMEFSLVWDMPVVSFPGKMRKYHKFYTKYFPYEQAILKIIDYAFKNYDDWEFAIYNWQKEIINDR